MNESGRCKGSYGRLTSCLLLVVLFLFPFRCSFIAEAEAFCFSDAGMTYGISPQLLQGIAKVESNLNPRAINKNLNGSVDMGLMQINSSWITRIGLDPDRLLTDACYNVMTGAKILRLCMDKYGYTWEAVGCYNAMSRHKRINYSWKVFEMLKTQEKNTKQGKPSDSSGYALKTLRQDSGMTILKGQQTLTFTVKDSAAIE